MWPALRSLVCAKVPPESENSLQSLTAARVVVVAGKGGVGKTTVTAVIARAASRSGRRVLVVELDGKPTLTTLVPGIEVMAISAPDALDDYLREHGFGRVATRLSKTGVIDVVGTAAPGIDDIVVLGKIKQLERAGAYDLIVVDGPAAGHAITFLTAASGLADSVKSGPIRTQADEVLEMLHDPARCQVVLVALPEATPVNEVIETAYALEDEVGVQLGPIVLNAVDELDALPTPDEIDDALGDASDDLAGDLAGDLDGDTASWLRAAAAFRRSRLDMQDDERRRLATEVPLTVLTLPDRYRAGLGRERCRAPRGSVGSERPARHRGTCAGIGRTNSGTIGRVRAAAVDRRDDRAGVGDRLLRLGWRGQDDHGGRDRAAGGRGGSAGRGCHDRPGPTARRRARSDRWARCCAPADRTCRRR